MTTIEQIKHDRDGLLIRADLPRLIAAGWTALTDGDIQRLKWLGIFLRHPTPGSFMLRVRIPGGRLTSHQFQTLATLATTHGNGILDLTTRQQIQLRHFRLDAVPALLEGLESVGLSSLQTGMDNPRNIMTCPVSDLSATACLDPTPQVQALTHALIGTPAFSNLPRKLNLAITGCPENCLPTETQDIALIPAILESDAVSQLGYHLLVGGKLGSGGYRIATPLDVFLAPEEVVPTCTALATLYRDHGFRTQRNTARLSFLLDHWGPAPFREALEATLGRPLRRGGRDLRQATVYEHLGLWKQATPGFHYLGLKIPVGRLTADDVHALTALATRYGAGELRLSPHQLIIIPQIPDARVKALLQEPLLERFPYDPAPLRSGLVSCVGSDYCNLAVIETKRRALEVTAAVEALLMKRLDPHPPKPITMHWSGCPASCGNHQLADIGFLGKKIRRDGQSVDAVDIYVGGRSGPQPKLALKLLEDIPCDHLPMVLSQLIPYHTRDKMHRGKPGPKAADGLPSSSVPPTRKDRL